MAKQLFANNASAVLASSLLSTDLSLSVASGQGALFPEPSGSDWFTVTLVGASTMEIVKVTARSSDTFTIVRAQEGTTAAAFAAGDAVRGYLTTAGLSSFVQEGEAAGGDLTGTYPNPTIKASVALTGTPTAPTAGPGTDTEQIATTEFVQQELAALPSSSAARASVSKTTASLTFGQTENGTVTLSKGGLLYSVTVDRACWIRLYATSADRTADGSRTLGSPASATTNILAEWSFTAAGTLRRLVVPYANGDGPAATSIYYAITNESGSTHTVQVDFVHLPLES